MWKLVACAVCSIVVAGCDCRGEEQQEVLPVSAATAKPCIGAAADSDQCIAVCRTVFELDVDADVVECSAQPSDTGSDSWDLYTEYNLPMQCPRK